MIIQAQNREQTLLFSSLEDLIEKDNPARIIEAIVTAVTKSNPREYDYRGNCETGRPAYSAITMLKLFLYGYINRIKSSRRLEVETHRNIELIWLLGNLRPDFKTIADFRKDNKDIIEKFNTGLRLFLKKAKLAKGQTVAIDGTKIKANASRTMLDKAEIIKRLNRLGSEMEEYLNQLETNDSDEETKQSEIARLTNSYDKKLEAMEQEMDRLNQALDKLKTGKKNYVSLTDMDCNKMKSRDGIIPGYNVQFATDVEHKFIVADLVTSEANDKNQLEPMISEVESQLGQKPDTALADTGYSNLDQVQLVESQAINCYVPMPAEQGKNKGITFTFDEENDRYTCSQGKFLVLKSKNKKYKNSWVNVYVGQCCQDCPIKSQCTKSKSGRHISRYWNQTYRDKHRQKMSTPMAIGMSKQRKSSIEHVFGTSKLWLGKVPLLTRGLANVSNEIKLLVASYNLKRLMSVCSFDELMTMISQFMGLDCQRTSDFLSINHLSVLCSNRLIRFYKSFLSLFINDFSINNHFYCFAS